jgi:hypothetical protein
MVDPDLNNRLLTSIFFYMVGSVNTFKKQVSFTFPVEAY